MIIPQNKPLYQWLSIQEYKIPYRILKGKLGYTKLRFVGGLLDIHTQSGTIQLIDKQLIDAKASWILEKALLAKNVWEKQKMLLDNHTSLLLYLGRYYALEFLQGKKRGFQLTNTESPNPTFGIIARPVDFERLTILQIICTAFAEIARNLVTQRVQFFAAQMNLKYNRISIKNQRSKWGSCSSNANLNFNWHLAMLSPHLIDYLVVHELAHLKHMNHSRQFWELVAQYQPDYLESDKELKGYSWLIGIYD